MRENNLNDNKIKPICLRFQTVAGDMFVAIITYKSFLFIIVDMSLSHFYTFRLRKTFSVFTFCFIIILWLVRKL